MGAFRDLTGQTFGRLTATKRVGTKNRSPLWHCQCSCGNIVEVTTRALTSGNTKSCGCIHSEQLAKRNSATAKHHMEGSRLYGVWHSMKQRCYDPNRKDYPNYGGRGIQVCSDWLNDFEAFYKWALCSGYDPSAPYMACTLDRIDVDGDYCPDNCRWVSMKVQANNRRKKCVA